jgi:hypothetical protein
MDLSEAWTIWSLPILAREQVSLSASDSSAHFLEERFAHDGWSRMDRSQAAITIGYYLKTPWAHQELENIPPATTETELRVAYDQTWVRRAVKAFGQSG